MELAMHNDANYAKLTRSLNKQSTKADETRDSELKDD
jgi:hypothetical protein